MKNKVKFRSIGKIEKRTEISGCSAKAEIWVGWMYGLGGGNSSFQFRRDPLRKSMTSCNATRVNLCFLNLMYAYFTNVLAIVIHGTILTLFVRTFNRLSFCLKPGGTELTEPDRLISLQFQLSI